MDKPWDDLLVTRNGVPFEDQAEGLRQFKAACLASKGDEPAPDMSPAGRYANSRNIAVTDEWKLGFNAAWDHMHGLHWHISDPQYDANAVPRKGVEHG